MNYLDEMKVSGLHLNNSAMDDTTVHRQVLSNRPFVILLSMGDSKRPAGQRVTVQMTDRRVYNPSGVYWVVGKIRG